MRLHLLKLPLQLRIQTTGKLSCKLPGIFHAKQMSRRRRGRDHLRVSATIAKNSCTIPQTRTIARVNVDLDVALLEAHPQERVAHAIGSRAKNLSASSAAGRVYLRADSFHLVRVEVGNGVWNGVIVNVVGHGLVVVGHGLIVVVAGVWHGLIVVVVGHGLSVVGRSLIVVGLTLSVLDLVNGVAGLSLSLSLSYCT